MRAWYRHANYGMNRAVAPTAGRISECNRTGGGIKKLLLTTTISRHHAVHDFPNGGVYDMSCSSHDPCLGWGLQRSGERIRALYTTDGKPRLLDQVREQICLGHYSIALGVSLLRERGVLVVSNFCGIAIKNPGEPRLCTGSESFWLIAYSVHCANRSPSDHSQHAGHCQHHPGVDGGANRPGRLHATDAVYSDGF